MPSNFPWLKIKGMQIDSKKTQQIRIIMGQSLLMYNMYHIRIMYYLTLKSKLLSQLSCIGACGCDVRMANKVSIPYHWEGLMEACVVRIPWMNHFFAAVYPDQQEGLPNYLKGELNTTIYFSELDNPNHKK